MDLELGIILICLAVAVYMAASLFYRPLRISFRLKESIAEVFRMNEFANQQFANRIGLIIAPVVGLAALAVCVVTAVSWKASTERERILGQHRELNLEHRLDILRKVLTSEEPQKIYFYRPQSARVLSQKAAGDVESFLRSVGAALSPDDVSEAAYAPSVGRGSLVVEFRNGPETGWNLSLAIDFEHEGFVAHGILNSGDETFVTVPASLRDRFDALRNAEYLNPTDADL